MNPPLLQVEDLVYTYPDGTRALGGVGFELRAGERAALLGPTGAGKSTLLLHLNGLLRAQSGRVQVDGIEVTEETLREVRRRVGLVFQEPDDQLFLPTLLEDVTFGPLNEGLGAHEAEHRALHVLEELGLEGKGSRPAHHLSGGERRLAALATVLVSRPPLLVLDEPTGSLDARGRQRLVEMLAARSETLLVATHDLAAAGALCERGIVLAEGRVVSDGPLADLLADPERLAALGLRAPFDPTF
jgi:cobalt/nickel transport system ATP-binding protein